MNSPIIGMWADYFKSGVEPTELNEPLAHDHLVVVHTGAADQMKIGGGSKIFTALFYHGEEEVKTPSGKWSFTIDGSDAASFVRIVNNPELSGSEIEVVLNTEYKYLGKDLVVAYTTEEGITGRITMDIAGL